MVVKATSVVCLKRFVGISSFHNMTNIIETSLEIALAAYKGQTDKAGKTYILHPLRLMAKMTTEDEMCVALLHDAIEDSDVTAQDLLDKGLPAHIVDAVVLMTHQDDESYDAYIVKIKTNPLAAIVKKCDIEDNINVLRLDALSDKDITRIKKYHRAWKQLDNL